MYDAVHKLSQQIDELERVMFSITGVRSINQMEFLRFMSALSNEDHRELGLLSALEKISFLVRRTHRPTQRELIWQSFRRRRQRNKPFYRRTWPEGNRSARRHESS